MSIRMKERKYQLSGSKKWIQGILLWCLLLSGCGDFVNPMDSAQNTIENTLLRENTTKSPVFPQNETLQAEHPEEVNLAGMLQNVAGKTMVQVQAQNFVGSGVILTADQENIYIVTAGHVLGQTDQNVKVIFVDGATAEVSEVFRSTEYDLAILKLATGDVWDAHSKGKNADLTMEETYATAAVSENGESSGPAVGDTAILISSVKNVAEEAYEGTVLEPWIYVEDFGCDMLLMKLDAEPGMSGGGVFTEQGYFLGILCGMDEDGEAAVLPIQIILNFRKLLDS